MREHRKLKKDYKEFYKEKLTKSKLPPHVIAGLEKCEKMLDIFNITLVRNQAKAEVSLTFNIYIVLFHYCLIGWLKGPNLASSKFWTPSAIWISKMFHGKITTISFGFPKENMCSSKGKPFPCQPQRWKHLLHPLLILKEYF